MKKILMTLVFNMVLLASLSAEITSHLNTYSSMECTFSERKTSNKKHMSSGRSHPHMPIEQGTSINWSGYAAATNLASPVSGTVSNVVGSWTVPNVEPTNEGYTALWVGIDGYGSPSVEQLGTEHDYVDGQVQHSAWYEMYPNPSYNINNFPLAVGDVIQAEVNYIGDHIFELSMVNHTQGVYTVIPRNLTKSSVAKRSSAEWILEAPYSSEVLPLSDFNQVAFTGCTTRINGRTGGVASKYWETDALNMATTSGVLKAVTSALTANDEAFTVSWKHE